MDGPGDASWTVVREREEERRRNLPPSDKLFQKELSREMPPSLIKLWQICLAQHHGKYFRDNFSGCSPHRLVVMPLGVQADDLGLSPLLADIGAAVVNNFDKTWHEHLLSVVGREEGAPEGNDADFCKSLCAKIKANPCAKVFAYTMDLASKSTCGGQVGQRLAFEAICAERMREAMDNVRVGADPAAPGPAGVAASAAPSPQVGAAPAAVVPAGVAPSAAPGGKPVGPPRKAPPSSASPPVSRGPPPVKAPPRLPPRDLPRASSLPAPERPKLPPSGPPKRVHWATKAKRPPPLPKQKDPEPTEAAPAVKSPPLSPRAAAPAEQPSQEGPPPARPGPAGKPPPAALAAAPSPLSPLAPLCRRRRARRHAKS